MLNSENHSFDIPEGCHWKDVREVSENVGVAIVNAMNGIERANPDTLAVFSAALMMPTGQTKQSYLTRD